MFCEKCGTQLEDGTLFCTNCGAKQDVPEVAPAFTPEATAAAPQQTYAQPVAPAAPKKPSFFSKIPVWGYIVAGVVLIALIVGGIFLGKYISDKKHTVDVADYITVEFEGYDTVGYATVELDEEFWEAVYDKASFKDKSRYEKEDFFSSYFTEAEYMEDEIGNWFSYSMDNATGLKNGDEVKIEYKVKTEKIKKKYGVIIKAEDQKFTVDGLEECETFDPFDEIEVKFSGVDGSGTADIEIVKERDVYDSISFYCDSYYLEEGDEVTVTFGSGYSEEDLVEYCANNYGCIPTETEKTYTVEGLGHYVNDASEIKSQDALGDLFEDGKETISDELFDYYYEEDELSITSMEYAGVAVRYEEGYGNYAYVAYKVTADVTTPDNDTDTVEFYSYVKVEDLVLNGDGTCTYGYIYGTPYDTCSFKVGDYNARFAGYSSLDDLKTAVDDASYSYEVVTSNF